MALSLQINPALRLAAPAARRRHVEAWAAAHLGTIEHERRVASLATRLFDLTAHLHGLGADRRELLRLAAIVHDVGRSIDDDGHERHGAKLLLRGVALRLPESVRRRLAFLTRHHRGRVPEPGRERHLSGGDERRPLRLLLALLRAADALDGRRLEAPHVTFTLRGDRLLIECELESHCPKAVRAYSGAKKLRLLEELLGLRVSTSCRVAPGLSLAA